MFSNLPVDLVEEILCRVPAKTLKRIRWTCKRWYTLCKDQRFTEKHFGQAPKESMVLLLKEFRFFPVNVNLNIAPPSIDVKGPLGPLHAHSTPPQQVVIIEVSHCNGLLLCVSRKYGVMVWNPCLGETMWIRPPKTCYMACGTFYLGYEINKSRRSYKIMGTWKIWGPIEDKFVFEIYEFSSDSWRFLDDVTLDRNIGANNVSMKGNTYWIHTKDVFLFCFDYTTERIKHVCLPTLEKRGWVTISAIREEQLSLLHRSYGTTLIPKIELWVTNKFDTVDALLWSKCFSVDTDHSFPWFFPTFLVDEEKKVALCCTADCKEIYIIGEDNECPTKLPLEQSINKYCWPLLFDYVPSLVQIQQGVDNETRPCK